MLIHFFFGHLSLVLLIASIKNMYFFSIDGKFRRK